MSQLEEDNLQWEYVETDPSGRYGRFKKLLGKGAMKKVYKAFDQVLGMEVAWNQVKLYNVFRSPDDLQRLYSEVHLLETLSHDSIMESFATWVNVERGTFNFITEMFTSGTLREYIQKYRKVDIRAIKNWARQILRGLAYLHGHDPIVIHRDLKCDNIFVNGHLGKVKIGDLGLAAILRGTKCAHSLIGTPEFMAPEIYEEEYNELVDVYALGMCVLEMFTSEYPYNECSDVTQIRNKVISGKLPNSLYRIEDAVAQRFILKCLKSASMRPSARELLDDPFLACDMDGALPIIPRSGMHGLVSVGMPKMDKPLLRPNSVRSSDMIITGTIDPTDGTVLLKVKINDKHGKPKYVHFPFIIGSDTAIDVATELASEFPLPKDWEPLRIAEMIEDEISTLVPCWKENYNQLSFNYNDEEEDNDDTTPNLFYTSYSCSSSQASIPGLYTPPKAQICFAANNTILGQDRVQGDFLCNEAASSHGSLNSYKYSELNYCSGKQDDDETSSKLPNCTRFCPEENKTQKHCHEESNSSFRSDEAESSNQWRRKMTRNKSLVDNRSLLLNRSLAEEVRKQRLYKTVGAVEDVGFKKPGEFDEN